MDEPKKEERRLYIHIGLHKTGTTFLQKEVFPKIHEIYYANPTTQNKWQCFITKKIPKSQITLISNEALSRHNFIRDGESSMKEIANRIYKLFPYARIILVIRDKDEWIKSLYNQYIKFDGSLDFDEWRETIFNSDDLDFEGYITHLKSLFPEVLVLNFELLKKNPNKFVSTICDFMGINSPNFSVQKLNVSMNKRQVKLMRFIKKRIWIPEVAKIGFFRILKLINKD